MNKKILALFLFLILANTIAWFFVFNEKNYLKVSFLNIGQGDSIFIETMNNYQILIDGGPDNSVLYNLEEQMGLFDKTIDLVILTHPDKDHYGGLIGVFEMYDVKNFIWTGQENSSDGFQRFKSLIDGYQSVYAGDRILIDDIVLSIMNPFFENESTNFNDNSIVCMLTHNNAKFLLTGDLTSKRELELINNFDVDTDVLKVGHHGSKHSTCDDFIKATTPQIAVIQVGKNSYGHPAEEVLKRLSDNNVKILRNDRDGVLVFYSNGERILFQREFDLK